MNIRAFIPNLFTLANLVCGSVAILHIIEEGYSTIAVFLIFLAGLFDLLDGAIARALHVSGELGKQLDSLADVVSFGLAPSVIIYKMLEETLPGPLHWIAYFAFLNVACAAMRLAKFNISTDQTHDFSGMPSPANGIFWASLAAVIAWHNVQITTGHFLTISELFPSSFIMTMFVITSILMVSKIRMFSFKFRAGGFATNRIPYTFILLLLLLALCCTFILQSFIITIPLAIILYMVMSMIYHFTKTSGQMPPL